MFMVIHVLQGFSNAIFREVVPQLTEVQLTNMLRAASAIAELFIIPYRQYTTILAIT